MESIWQPLDRGHNAIRLLEILYPTPALDAEREVELKT